jgi:hypothetical protein
MVVLKGFCSASEAKLILEIGKVGGLAVVIVLFASNSSISFISYTFTEFPKALFLFSVFWFKELVFIILGCVGRLFIKN